jgi:diguanylate cyclase (GGDEF)-like protein
MEEVQLMDEYLIRTDQVTGCQNLIAFAEMITSFCSAPMELPYSLIVIDINSMRGLNQLRGYSEGSNTLRWVALLVQSELQSTVYRIDGDEFVVILTGENPIQIDESAHRLFQQLNRRAEDFGLHIPLATVSAIHFSGHEKLHPADYFAQIYYSIGNVKKYANRAIKSFQFDELDPESNARSLRRVADNLVARLINLGTRLDESLEMAFQDATTGLPNQRMAQSQMEKWIASAARENHPLTLLLIDGDDLHRYNEISYADGDEMIRLLGKVIKQALRPEDFLARWRVGDEFLVLLANMNIHQGITVGERICAAVEQASRHWKLPVTVSVGAVAFPDHGTTPEELFHNAELANSLAKLRGKNQVTSFFETQMTEYSDSSF